MPDKSIKFTEEEMLENTIKFTEEEMKELNELQQEYVNLQAGFGQIHIDKMRLDSQLTIIDNAEEDLQSKYKTAQETEQQFLAKITEKYGEGSLNAVTGEFTPVADNQTASTSENSSDS